jgi:hypothetical protein
MDAKWRRVFFVLLASGALAGAFVLRACSSSAPPQTQPPETDVADRGNDTTENGSSLPYELSPAQVPEKGPGDRLFGSWQAFESDAELWIFLDVDVRIPRPPPASPSYGEYQLALHTFVLDMHGAKGRYAMPPALTANSNITHFFPYNGSFYAWQWPSASNPARFYRWSNHGFEQLSQQDHASLAQKLGIAGLKDAQMEDRLLDIARKNGFRRIADDRALTQIVSERLGLQVEIGGSHQLNQMVAESLDSGKSWREVLLEIDPNWSGDVR